MFLISFLFTCARRLTCWSLFLPFLTFVCYYLRFSDKLISLLYLLSLQVCIVVTAVYWGCFVTGYSWLLTNHTEDETFLFHGLALHGLPFLFTVYCIPRILKLKLKNQFFADVFLLCTDLFYVGYIGYIHFAYHFISADKYFPYPFMQLMTSYYQWFILGMLLAGTNAITCTQLHFLLC